MTTEKKVLNTLAKDVFGHPLNKVEKLTTINKIGEYGSLEVDCFSISMPPMEFIAGPVGVLDQYKKENPPISKYRKWLVEDDYYIMRVR